MSTYASGSRSSTVAPTTYRPTYQQPIVPPTRNHNVTDDYERWYTEHISNNRMALSLQSGIDEEVGWALDRLLRLCANENFGLKDMPGVIDGLFVLPEWYILEGYRQFDTDNALFAIPRELQDKRRQAVESMFVLRNCAHLDADCQELVSHPHTLPLIINAIKYLDSKRDENVEFLIHAMELLLLLLPSFSSIISSTIAFNIIHAVQKVALESTNRPFIISALTVTSALLTNPVNWHLFSPDAPALAASLRYLPLLNDKKLIDACLNYLYAHLSQQNMARSFLLHPDMPSVLRVLVNLIKYEQVDENVSFDITGDVRSVPSIGLVSMQLHQLTEEEAERLLPLPEPQRCFEWMRTMFVGKEDGELTQVDFWNFYRDVFGVAGDRYPPALGASEVIKYANDVFPLAQAMVVTDPNPRFVLRGIDRRIDTLFAERLKCQWDKGTCDVPAFPTLSKLYEHILGHVDTVETLDSLCLWSTCPKAALSKAALRAHVVTHLSSKHAPEKHPSQSDTITMTPGHNYPSESPINRAPPPPRSTTIVFPSPVVDPPTTSLTALLCIRTLFRLAFTDTEEAPRVDEDHFGFPGIVEDFQQSDDHQVLTGEARNLEKDGQKRGRRAFATVRTLLDNVRIRDETLMSWVVEMSEAGLTGSMLD